MGGDRMWLHPSRKKQINCAALVAVYVYMSWLLPFVYLSTAKTTANITKQSRKLLFVLISKYVYDIMFYSFHFCCCCSHRMLFELRAKYVPLLYGACDWLTLYSIERGKMMFCLIVFMFWMISFCSRVFTATQRSCKLLRRLFMFFDRRIW